MGDPIALKKNLRLANFEQAARNLEQEVVEVGLPLIREDVLGSRVLICEVQSEDDPWHAEDAPAGELVAVLLASGRRPNTRLCSERKVYHRRGKLWTGRPTAQTMGVLAKRTLSVRLSSATIHAMADQRPDLVTVDAEGRARGVSTAARVILNEALGLPEDA